MIRNTKSSWGSLSRWLHWGLGLAIIGMIAYGWWMNHIPARPDRFFYRSIHANIGYAILLLMALRLIWRAFNPVPAMPEGIPRWQRIAASVNHWILYAVTNPQPVISPPGRVIARDPVSLTVSLPEPGE